MEQNRLLKALLAGVLLLLLVHMGVLVVVVKDMKSMDTGLRDLRKIVADLKARLPALPPPGSVGAPPGLLPPGQMGTNPPGMMAGQGGGPMGQGGQGMGQGGQGTGQGGQGTGQGGQGMGQGGQGGGPMGQGGQGMGQGGQGTGQGGQGMGQGTGQGGQGMGQGGPGGGPLNSGKAICAGVLAQIIILEYHADTALNQEEATKAAALLKDFRDDKIDTNGLSTGFGALLRPDQTSLLKSQAVDVEKKTRELLNIGGTDEGAYADLALEYLEKTIRPDKT